MFVIKKHTHIVLACPDEWISIGQLASLIVNKLAARDE